MKKIVITTATTLRGKEVEVGTVCDVDDATCETLISQKQASLYVEKPKPIVVESETPVSTPPVRSKRK